MNHLSIKVIAVSVLPACAASCFAGAGLVNGNFEAGNTGFTSQYQFKTVSVAPFTNQYGVTHSSFEWTNFWSTVRGDHTTGRGLFLIADVGSSDTIWQETIDVIPCRTYSLSACLATWSAFPPCHLGVEINGELVTTWTGPSGGQWTPYSTIWNSGANTNATIRFYATTVFQPGDDVAIDDVVFTPLDCPDADLDGDCAVNGADLGLLLSQWGTDACAADLNDDGTVDGADLGLALGEWTG